MSILQKILKRIFSPLIVRSYKKWYEETMDWKKSDWKNWQAERFEEIKKSKWTLKHFPWLRDVTYEDLPNIPIQETYKEAPEDFPAVTSYYSTGTIERKLIKISKRDGLNAIKAIGRCIIWLKGEPQLRKTLIIGDESLLSGRVYELVNGIISKKAIVFSSSEILFKMKELKKYGPFDSVGLTLPVAIPFFRKIEENFFTSPSFIFIGGDIVTDYLRLLISNKSQELDTILYVVDAYGTSETILIGMEIPPLVARSLVYIPELSIVLIKKEDGSLVNLFDAKPGDRGEIIATPLMDYTVPNYRVRDLIEVIHDNTPLNLPSFRVLGKVLHKVRLNIPKLGVIEGFAGTIIRAGGIVIKTQPLIQLIHRNFMSECLILIKRLEDKVRLIIYTEKQIKLEEFLAALQKDHEINYLINDMKIGALEVELIHDPEVIEELVRYVREHIGAQAEIPRAILVEK